MKAEVLKAIEELKTGKAEVTDNIPAEMLKILKGTALDEKVLLCQQMYSEGKWPEDFIKSVMVPLKKKSAAEKCEDHRTITLTSHASKIMLKILTRKLENKLTAVIGQDQFGFIKGRGTREVVAVMRILAERSIEHGQELYVSFVDFEKAFDRVNWEKLTEILKSVGVDWRDRRLISELYMQQTATVRTKDGKSEPAVIGRGVRQGCLISPSLFNIFAEVRTSLDNCEERVKVGGQMVKAVRFADDQAMVADSAKVLQEIMDSLNTTTEDFGMKINPFSASCIVKFSQPEPILFIEQI